MKYNKKKSYLQLFISAMISCENQNKKIYQTCMLD